MITRIQVRNYKSLRYADVPLKGFHVLVDPNASGKSAFLDVISFLHDFISEDLEYAVKKRTDNFFDLVWGRGEIEQGFEIAVEAEIPESIIQQNQFKNHGIRYELRIMHGDNNEIFIEQEQGYLKISDQVIHELNDSIISSNVTQNHLCFYRYDIANHEKMVPNEMRICFKNEEGKSKTFYTTKYEKDLAFNEFSALKTEKISTLFDYLIKKQISFFDIYGPNLRPAIYVKTGEKVLPDGTNISWVVEDFKKRNPDRFKEWIQHIKTSLPDLVDIRAFVRPEDRHCFLMLKYKNGVELPSWTVSDGTLHLLALTLPAYLPDAQGIYMFEEPENGIHPQAIETVMDSMKSFYGGQVLITTHSPLILSLVEPEDILCFSNHPEKGMAIITGDNHPVLQEWKKHKNRSSNIYQQIASSVSLDRCADPAFMKLKNDSSNLVCR